MVQVRNGQDNSHDTAICWKVAKLNYSAGLACVVVTHSVYQPEPPSSIGAVGSYYLLAVGGAALLATVGGSFEDARAGLLAPLWAVKLPEVFPNGHSLGLRKKRGGTVGFAVVALNRRFGGNLPAAWLHHSASLYSNRLKLTPKPGRVSSWVSWRLVLFFFFRRLAARIPVPFCVQASLPRRGSALHTSFLRTRI